MEGKVADGPTQDVGTTHLTQPVQPHHFRAPSQPQFPLTLTLFVPGLPNSTSFSFQRHFLTIQSFLSWAFTSVTRTPQLAFLLPSFPLACFCPSASRFLGDMRYSPSHRLKQQQPQLCIYHHTTAGLDLQLPQGSSHRSLPPAAAAWYQDGHETSPFPEVSVVGFLHVRRCAAVQSPQLVSLVTDHKAPDHPSHPRPLSEKEKRRAASLTGCFVSQKPYARWARK
ncbi:hypothetical protein V8F20_009982 [Naviculisporaceae sp. PSN 640]